MLEERQPRLLPPSGRPIGSLQEYRTASGGDALLRALEMSPAEVVAELESAGLRGRGGAGFPTATKWEGALSSNPDLIYLVANGAEGEPGTFKDRYLMRMNPYAVIEGVLIAIHTLSPERAYIGIKESFTPEDEALTRALSELAAVTPLAERIEIVRGPDEYLFGEETGLMEVIEGGLPLPRVFPPYMHGLFSGAYGGTQPNVTVVNNVETLAHIPGIILKGSTWFRSVGDDTPGTAIFTLSGDVRRPCVEEIPMGVSLSRVIDDVAGGVQPGRQIKAVFPGLANAAVPLDALATPLGFDSMRGAGSSLGSAGFIIYDDTRCMVYVAYLFSRFLHVESCNQCAPCKMGTEVMLNALDRLVGGTGSPDDLREIEQATQWVENGKRCYLPTSASLVIGSIVRSYGDDFRKHFEGSTCDLEHDVELPKIVDYESNQGFSYDQLYAQKQADWSSKQG